MLRRYLGRPYLRANAWIWRNLVAGGTPAGILTGYGIHLHKLRQTQAKWAQSTGTFFFRNRPALSLLVQLIERMRPQSAVNLAVLGCSKGAGVYSISYAVSRANFDLAVKIFGVDIEPDILEFARAGVTPLAPGMISPRTATASSRAC